MSVTTPSTDRILRYFDSKLQIVWKGNQGIARCPFHQDHRPSFSVNAENGVFFCHGCGAKGGLVDFEQRISGCERKVAKQQIAKLRNAPGSTKSSNIAAQYPYENPDRQLVYEAVRLKPKTFRFRRPDGSGGWIWNLQGIEKVLYRLPEVLGADEIFIVEGEKDADTLRSWGLTATCNPGGAGKWSHGYSQVLKGKRVVILQDDDEPGWKHARAVAASVVRYAAEVKLIPPFKGAKDISDWVENGGIKADLLDLVQKAPVFKEDCVATTPGGQSAEGLLSPKDWRSQPLRGRWVVAMLEGFFAEYAILPRGLPFVLALWVLGTLIFEAFDVFPYLSVTSPTKRCGKTRLAELIELLCKRVLSSVNISEAALFRTIHQLRPVVIIDEAETLGNRTSERSQYLLALLQAGFKDGAVVPRCAGRGYEVEYFSVYCPKVVLAIGTLPDTLLDRSIHIIMQRKRPDQSVAQFRRRIAKEQADGPRNAAEVWCETHRDAVTKAYLKSGIDFLQDREADIWEPLFAIASIADPHRLGELQRIAQHLSAEKKKLDVDESEGLKLLADIRTIFDRDRITTVHTNDLLLELRSLPESRWLELKAHQLARILRPFQIASRQVWIKGKNRRGYDRADFEAAFEAYAPLSAKQPESN